MAVLSEVASSYGRYHYLLDGEPAPIDEHWSRTPRAGGGWFVRSIRNAGDITLTVNAECEAGLVLQCNIEWIAGEQSPVRAFYRLEEDGVSVIRQCGDEVAEHDMLAADGEGRLPLVLPLLRIFTGSVISRLLDDGERAVLVPSIIDPEDRAALLRPRLGNRAAAIVQSGEEQQLFGRQYKCQRCTFTGDQYGEDSQFWLSEDETLLRYVWPQPGVGTWDIRLEELTKN
ncbi:MAG: hypothetical protein ABJK20_16335 [Halieaceae bacterium]